MCDIEDAYSYEDFILRGFFTIKSTTIKNRMSMITSVSKIFLELLTSKLTIMGDKFVPKVNFSDKLVPRTVFIEEVNTLLQRDLATSLVKEFPELHGIVSYVNNRSFFSDPEWCRVLRNVVCDEIEYPHEARSILEELSNERSIYPESVVLAICEVMYDLMDYLKYFDGEKPFTSLSSSDVLGINRKLRRLVKLLVNSKFPLNVKDVCSVFKKEFCIYHLDCETKTFENNVDLLEDAITDKFQEYLDSEFKHGGEFDKRLFRNDSLFGEFSKLKREMTLFERKFEVFKIQCSISSTDGKKILKRLNGFDISKFSYIARPKDGLKDEIAKGFQTEFKTLYKNLKAYITENRTINFQDCFGYDSLLGLLSKFLDNNKIISDDFDVTMERKFVLYEARNMILDIFDFEEFKYLN